MSGSDSIVIHDRPNHLVYSIDDRHKVARVQRDKGTDAGALPETREQFESAHAGQERLGTKTFSGIECEGYRVPNKYSKKRWDEFWYAPSLNFLAIESVTYTKSGHKVETRLQDIRIGVDADPKFFKVPEGFKVVGK